MRPAQSCSVLRLSTPGHIDKGDYIYGLSMLVKEEWNVRGGEFCFDAREDVERDAIVDAGGFFEERQANFGEPALKGWGRLRGAGWLARRLSRCSPPARRPRAPPLGAAHRPGGFPKWEGGRRGC